MSIKRTIGDAIQIEDENVKIVRSKEYNYNFDKNTGFFVRWGKTKEDDPIIAPFPEILDIEVSEVCNGVPDKNGIEKPCHFCSPKNTKVNTPTGYKNIEDVSVGDTVLSFDGEKIVNNTVVETYKHSNATEIITLELEDGKILKLTPDHLVFLTNGKTKPAGELTLDDDVAIL